MVAGIKVGEVLNEGQKRWGVKLLVGPPEEDAHIAHATEEVGYVGMGVKWGGGGATAIPVLRSKAPSTLTLVCN